MSIPFTQYLLPNGRRQLVTIDMPADIEDKALELIKAGCHFDAEVLRTGIVSFTCEKEDVTLAAQLSPNGPPVVSAVTELVDTAHKYLAKVQAEIAELDLELIKSKYQAASEAEDYEVLGTYDDLAAFDVELNALLKGLNNGGA